LKISVTGASGFIGRHVLNELARHSVEVTAVTRDAAKLADAGKSVKVVELDIGKPNADDYERLNRPDVLIHLAWDGLPNYKATRHIDVEMPKQKIFLEGLIQSGLSSLVVSGTCFEYGMQSGTLSENLSPKPSTAYGVAKDQLRRDLELLQSNYRFVLTWARLFYMYGEGQHKDSLYSQIREAVLHGDKVFNMSGGEQLRDYLSVTEVAEVIVMLAMRHCNAGIVNVCSGKPISIRALVENWIRENGWRIELNFGYFPYSGYEPMEFWGDNSVLKSIMKRELR